MKGSQKTKTFLLILGTIVFVVSFLSLLTALLLFQGDRGRQNIAGFIFVGSLIIDVFIIKAAQRIRTTETQHVEVKQFTLPYRTKTDKTYTLIFLGLGVLLFLMPLGAGLSHGRHLSTPLVMDWNNGQASIALPMWIFVMGAVFLCIVPLYFLVTYQGIVIYQNRVCYYQLWMKKNILFTEMEKVEINYVPWNYGSHVYLLSIHCMTKNIPPLKVVLTTVDKHDLVIILNVIHQSAPNAIFNDLAEQMRQGIFAKNIM